MNRDHPHMSVTPAGRTLGWPLPVTAGALALVVLGFDLSLPLGIAGGVPYVALVLLGIWFPRRKDIFILAAVGSALTILGYFLSPAGGIFWVVMTNRGLALFAIWVTAFLIASRKRTGDILRESEGVLRTFLDATIDKAMLVDPDATIRAVNKAMADGFAMEPRELIGLPMFKSPLTETGRRRKQWFDKVLRTGRPLREEDEHEGVWYDNSFFPVIGPDGKVARIAIFSRDISKRKRSEQELLVARRKAEAADRSKGEFLATMSHELRTPLNAIIGFSYSMLEEMHGPFSDEKYREYAGDIHQSGSHLLSLINDILDVSAIDAGKLELQEERIDVAEVVGRSVRLIKPRAEIRDVDISVSIQDAIPMLFADARRVHQVLLNLLSNAVKFSHRDGVVSMDVRMDSEGSMEFVISDKGIGMDGKELAIAMERFGQIDGKAKIFEGTGLGLPLAKVLIELHGGTLNIDTEKGAGTTVRVKFPKERVVGDA